MEELSRKTLALRQENAGLKKIAGDVNPTHIQKIEADYEKYVKLWRKRKRLVDHIVGEICEGMQKKAQRSRTAYWH